MVKERLDKFFVSSSWLHDLPFLASDVIHQASSDHDVVVLDTLGHILREWRRDSRLLFHFEAC